MAKTTFVFYRGRNLKELNRIIGIKYTKVKIDIKSHPNLIAQVFIDIRQIKCERNGFVE